MFIFEKSFIRSVTHFEFEGLVAKLYISLADNILDSAEWYQSSSRLHIIAINALLFNTLLHPAPSN